MVIPVVVLNLLVVLGIALWGSYKSRDLPVNPTVNLLLEYAIMSL